MSKAMLILDEMPDSCRECLFRRKDSMIAHDRYTFEQLYTCQVTPEDIWFCGEDEDEEVNIYVNEHMINQTKPDWCPLKEVKDE